MMTKFILLARIFLIQSTFMFVTMISFSQNSTKKIYHTEKLVNNSSIIIDGYLNDSSWELVPWGNDFIEVYPDENTSPTEETKFKILYDEKYIYIALLALDSNPSTITNRLSRRDGFEGDRVNVLIDSYHDLRTAFLFTVTAAGVRGDEIITNNGDDIDDSWNPIWTTKAKIITNGWSAEMKIPLSQLRFGDSDEQVWGLNVARNLFKENELSAWNRIPVGSAGWVSEAGELRGLKDIRPQKQIEIQPFIVSKFETYEPEDTNPFKSDGQIFQFNSGLDAKIGITNDLTLDITINPDFGQVEADPAAIALDGFEIFNREQRPFFVENKNIFSYRYAGNQNDLFFSRRIGRPPQVYPDLEQNSFINRPQNTTILAAAKFSGKTKAGWSIGLLSALTSNEYADIESEGNSSETLVEPLTNYFVARLQKDMNQRNTFLGAIFTSVNRSAQDATSILRDQAYSTGIDFRHQWLNRTYYLQSNVVASHVIGSPESILETQQNLAHLFNRVDADHVSVDSSKTSMTGTGGLIEIGKDGGRNWNYDLAFKWSSPELELNDIGFMRRADSKFQVFNLDYKTAKPISIFRRINFELNQFSSFDFGNNHNRTQFQIKSRLTFLNNSSLNFGYTHRPRNYRNAELRGGPRWRFSQDNRQFLYFRSDDRRNFNSRIGIVHSQAKENNFSFLKFDASFNYQPFNAFNISFSPEYEFRPNKTQYVATRSFDSTTRYIMGTIENRTLKATLRINYAINPNLSIQFYAEPFISTGEYTEFKYVTNSTASSLTDRFQLYDLSQIEYNNDIYSFDDNLDGNSDYSISNPDFSFAQFNSNLVLRWEYIPGSELFLVWSQGLRNEFFASDSLIDGIQSGIIDQRPQNIFLIKYTYRFIL